MHAVYRVTARNTAADSENKIHEDEVARRHGFAGGLVPGVTTWAYLCRPVAETFGLPWVERGTMSARFVHPVYDGELLEIGAADLGGTGLELTATNPEGEVCAVGTAGLPPKPAAPPAVEDYQRVELPSTRPAASHESLAVGTMLGTLEVGFHADRASEYLAMVDDDLPLWTAERVAHPGWLVLFANRVLVANVELGPWVHITSEAHHLGAVRDGDRVEVRPRVTGLRERKGNEIVELDILYVVDDDRPVMRLLHSAIWRMADRG